VQPHPYKKAEEKVPEPLAKDESKKGNKKVKAKESTSSQSEDLKKPKA